MTIREQIIAHRKRLGWSQEMLADLAGVHAQTVFKIEAGHVSPTASTLEKLAKALGVPLEVKNSA